MRPFYLLTMLLGLAACSGDDVPSGDPGKAVHPQTYGAQIRGDRVIDKNLKVHWLQEYVSGYGEPDPTAQPAAIRTINTTANCRFPKPRPGAVLTQVLTDHGNGAVPLHWLSDSELVDQAKRFISVISSNTDPGLMLSKNDAVLNRIDVIVTETSHPVHLVLAARSPTFWNIQKADTASISGITVISGSEAAAVGNVDANVPISALVGKAAESCGAIPAYWPVLEYPGLPMQIFKANHPELDLAKQQSAYGRYNSFFTAAFGQSATDMSVGAESIDHAVVGPTPATLDARVPFKGYGQTTVYTTPAALVVFGSDSDYGKVKRAAMIKTASRLTGGDYASIMQQAGY